MRDISTTIGKFVDEPKVRGLEEKIDNFYLHLKRKHGDSEVLREAAYFFPFIVKEHYSNEFEKIIKGDEK